jgi:signal transduction histidine kinase
MARAFSAMAGHQDKDLSTSFVTGLRVRVDQADFEEIIGNLLDNALKWSTRRILFETLVKEGRVTISIEDDGPGIREKDYDLATRSGQRLDTSQPGTGLGLAITSDLVQAYGGTLILKKSETLSGLQTRVSFPLFGI